MLRGLCQEAGHSVQAATNESVARSNCLLRVGTLSHAQHLMLSASFRVDDAEEVSLTRRVCGGEGGGEGLAMTRPND